MKARIWRNRIDSFNLWPPAWSRVDSCDERTRAVNAVLLPMKARR